MQEYTIIDFNDVDIRIYLDPNCSTLLVFLKEFLEKVDFEKKSDDKKAYKITP